MTNEQLHQLPVGAYFWAYYSSGYSASITTLLGRVLEHPTPDTTKVLMVSAGQQFAAPEVIEQTFAGETKDYRFASTDSWEAERWLIDNAVETKLKKATVEAEANHHIAVGKYSSFYTLHAVRIESLPSEVEEPCDPPMDEPYEPPTDDEIPF